MWNGRKWLLTALTAISFLTVSLPANADSLAPYRSSKTLSPDERFVFVMISPEPLDKELKHWNDDYKSGIRELRNLYSKSGLYRNDGTNNPLWTVDWYAHTVEIASDGIHLVRHGLSNSSIDNEAFSFFANGKLLKNYPIREVIDFKLFLPRSVSNFDWIEKLILDDGNLQYTLTTKDRNQFTFDMKTGEIVYAIRPGRWFVGSVLLLLFVILFGSAWVFERKRKQV